MGKASSAKKVARAARAGGRSASKQRRNLVFPGALALIAILGLGLIIVATRDHKSEARVPPLAMQDHWHAAYGFYTCDEFQPPIPEFENTSGVHSHGDGVIHIHPYSSAGEGKNANMGTFLSETYVKLSDDELRIGDESWKTGETKCGDEAGELVVAKWSEVQGSTEKPTIIRDGFKNIRFSDGEGYTIAFVPEGTTDIPRPPTSDNLAELGAIDQGLQPPPDGGVPPAGDQTPTGEPGQNGEEPDDSTPTTVGEQGTTSTTGG